MFTTFFHRLKAEGVPVTLKELLMLLEALSADAADRQVDNFYVLARAALVKDERHLDTFDRVFGHVFRGLVGSPDPKTEIPTEWLQSLRALALSDEDKAKVEALGGWDAVMEELRKRLAEQKGKHQGGSKWIGTGGTSPFGADGYNPEGVRIGQSGNRNFRAIKVWDRREFKDLAGDVEIGTRNIKVALRRLRKLARTGSADELDLDSTVRATAKKGYLDVHLRPERRNAVKVLLLLDVGGSMDWHVKIAEELFSAARAEFKHLQHFYFHNCLYDHVWRDNGRRHTQRFPTWDLLHTYPSDYKVIFVGDAAMSPYEVAIPGGSVEHMNEESGETWLRRVLHLYRHAVWLNPVAEHQWGHTTSTRMIHDIMGGRMFPLTLDGLDRATRELTR